MTEKLRNIDLSDWKITYSERSVLVNINYTNMLFI